jgi:hypothetical protein
MTATNTNKPIADQTPKEIDAQLAEIWGRQAQAQSALVALHDRVASYTKHLAAVNPSRQSSSFMRESYAATIAEAEAAIPAAEAALDAIIAEALPFQAEYMARGTWTRAYLVTNTGGHVHRSMHCGTCFPSTQFAWLPEVSGDDEASIVERAGEAACTTCYPSAPVDVLKRKSTFEAPDRKAARIEREVKAAARAAKAAATGITNPNGSPLLGRWGVIKTERSAQIEAVTELANHVGYGYSLDGGLVERITAALAAKRGQTADEVLVELSAKAAAKVKRESRR